MVFSQSNLAAVMLHLHVYELNSRFWRKLERLVVKVAAWKDKPVETVDQYDLREWVEFVNCRNLARKAAKTGDSRDLAAYLLARRQFAVLRESA